MADSQGKSERRLICVAGLLLTAGTLLCYWPACHFDYLNFDDPIYVSRNPIVLHGLSWSGVIWAFQSADGGNWHPLVWLSHMLDCAVFGPRPAGHHLTNILLHAVNVLLLFLVFWRMTTAVWRSAFVAAIFAWHPLHVESVAWISERKDVLSTVFWLLTMWTYTNYARETVGRWKFYTFALLCFVVGLLSKPMLVSLPVILLLLDFWPLRRAEPFRRLVIEKIPFAVCSVAACAAAIWAKRTEEAVGSQNPLLRFENSAVSCVTYLTELFLPIRLAAFYPFPHVIPFWQAAAAVLVILAITVVAIFTVRRRPYLFTGWFWYAITLLPVIGLHQIGLQARADHYTYIPYIGLALMLSWGLGDIAQRWPSARAGLVFAAAAWLVCCIVLSARQLQVWRNSVSLFQHAIEVTSGNYIAHSNLGYALTENGRLDEAVTQFKEVIRLLPGMANPYNDLGKVYALQNNMTGALIMFSNAVQLNPHLPEARWNFGNTLLQQGQTAEGLAEMEVSVEQRPDDIEAQGKLVDVLFKLGKGADAVPYCRKVVEARPTDPHAWFGLGAAWLAQSRMQDAIESFKQAIELAPDNPQCLNALAWIYATSSDPQLRNGPEAIRLAEKACAITRRQNPAQLETLAAAYAQAGRFDDAVKTAEEMLAIAQTSGDFSSREIGRKHLELYKAGKPCCGAP